MASTSVRQRPVFGAAAADMQFNTDNGKGDHCDDATSFSASADLPTASRRRLQLPPFIDGFVWLLIFSFFGVILLYVHVVFNTFPAAVTVNRASADQFVEERARKTLNDLSSFGARPVGSKANEELTVDYLVNEIARLKSQMNVGQHSLDIDVQRVSGSFSLEYRGHHVNRYDSVNNVIAKLCPKHGYSDSLLINCHYDSAINVTGMYVHERVDKITVLVLMALLSGIVSILNV